LITPSILYELAPLAVMLAGVLTVMVLSKHSEIVAMRTLGVRGTSVILPFLWVAFVIGGVMLSVQAFAIPDATARAAAIWQVHVKKAPPRGVLQGDRLFYRGERSIWATELADPDATRLTHVTWMSFDQEYRFQQSVSALWAEYAQGAWTFREGVLKRRQGRDGVILAEDFDVMTLEPRETPADFVGVRRPTEEMDLLSLWQSVKRLKQAGQPAAEKETILWGEILYPFLGCTLLLVGLPLMLSRSRGGVALGLGAGLIFGFLAWVSWSFALTLGKTGTLPPLLASSLVHLALVAAGAVLTGRLRF
jgi:lipopolysaccharide export system permease protein